jgi:cytochrome bd-type quinol oxidase subunit 2
MFHNENLLNGPRFSNRSTTFQYHQTDTLNFYTLLPKSEFIEPSTTIYRILGQSPDLRLVLTLLILTHMMTTNNLNVYTLLQSEVYRILGQSTDVRLVSTLLILTHMTKHDAQRHQALSSFFKMGSTIRSAFQTAFPMVVPPKLYTVFNVVTPPSATPLFIRF